MGDRTDELRALEQVVEICRLKAADLDMPGLVHILRRAELSLSDHALRIEKPQIPRAQALSVPRPRVARH